jgi:hypothetical protein
LEETERSLKIEAVKPWMETPLDKTTSVSTTTLNRQSTVVHEALSYLLYLGFGSAAIAIPRMDRLLGPVNDTGIAEIRKESRESIKSWL